MKMSYKEESFWNLVFLALAVFTVGLGVVLPGSSIDTAFYKSLLLTIILFPIIYFLAFVKARKHSEELDKEINIINTILHTYKESSLDGILIVNKDGKMSSFNKRFIKMWGITPDIVNLQSDESAIKSVLDRLCNPEEFISRIKFLYEHKDEESEEEIQLVDGRVFDRNSAPIIGASREYYGRIWYFRDITERKNTEKEIKKICSELEENIERRTEELLKTNSKLQEFKFISDNASDAHFLSGRDAKFRYVNKAACKMLGYSEDELLKLGVPDVDIVYDDKKYKTLFDSRQRTHILPVETINKRKEGSLFPSEVTLTGYRINEKQYILAVVRDISGRKQAEEKLARQTEELKRSNTSLEQFAYIASHDLKEPLRTIESFSKLLTKHYKDKLDGNVDEFIGYITNASARMGELITGLMKYSQVDKIEQKLKHVNCNDILKESIENLRIAIEESNAVITHANLPIINGNSIQILQLFQNLLSNAIKSCKDKQPQISIEAKRDNGTWVFSIADNGIGIKPEFYERIFVIFRKVHTQEDFSGVGIGLSICKRIVNFHGGKIWVESEPKKGSTFYFTLPGISTGIEKSLTTEYKSTITPTGTNHILVVDDDLGSIAIFKNMMKEYDVKFTASYVTNGTSAIDYIFGNRKYSERSKYPECSVVLLDINMPGLNGFEVLSAIRADRRFDSVRIAMFTVSSRPSDNEKALRMGADKYISKGYDFEKVFSEIEDMISK